MNAIHSKRSFFLIVLLVVASLPTTAQTFNEWFRQKATQRKYLLQQIAALQTYLGYVKKGYQVVNSGLTTIGKIKDGDFNLHRDFFARLQQINPAVLRYARTADMAALQLKTMNTCREELTALRAADTFDPSDKAYLEGVYQNILNNLLDDGAALSDLVTTGAIAMSDAERIERITQLRNDILDKYEFTMSFTEQVHLLTAQQHQELRDIESLRKIIRP